jgi:Fic family protein
MFDPQAPFNDLPPLPPRTEIETKPVLKLCIAARASLASLREAAKTIPNESVLIHALPLLEAKDSSEIENVITTTDKLFIQAQLFEENADPATKEALRYRTALWKGFESLRSRPLCTNTAIEICQIIKAANVGIRTTPGTALVNDKTGEKIYTPPEGEALLRMLLKNWEIFIHESEDIDPLVRMAVQHYQFEAIHPFTDGNGRTGRILNILTLVDQKLIDLPIIYPSRYIIQTKSEYYSRLLGVTRDRAWEQWILYMLGMIEASANYTYARIASIAWLVDATRALLKRRAPKIYSAELLNTLFAMPYTRISDLAERNIAQRQTSALYLNQLVNLGLLSDVKVGREKLFLNNSLLKLLKLDDDGLADGVKRIVADLERL